MGVPGLFPYIKTRTNSVKKSVNNKQVTGLCIDTISYIHEAISIYYGKDVTPDNIKILKRATESDIYDLIASEVYNSINKIIKKVSPRSFILVAFDGVSPLVKTIHRKQKRWTTAITEDMTFDTNAISTGTQFIDEIVTRVKDELKIRHKHGVDLYFSSHRSVGEGEHKIFDFVRDKYKRYKAKKNTSLDTVVINGNDADLILLGLMIDKCDIVIRREVNHEISYIHISNLKDWLKFKMWPERSQPIYDDFVLITFFVGNDFIPPVPECEEQLFNVLDEVISVYSSMNRGGRLSIVTGNCNIEWSSLLKFLKAINITKLISCITNTEHFNTHSSIKYANISVTDTKKGVIFTGISHINFVEKYYNSKLGLWGQRFSECNSGYNIVNISEIVVNWMQAMLWILLYYKKSISDPDCSIEFYYPYFISPSISSIIVHLLSLPDITSYTSVNSLMPLIDEPELDHGEFLTASQELIAILPVQSHYLLPKALRRLLRNEAIADYPLSVHIDKTCKVKEFKAITMVPSIDIDKIRQLHSEVDMLPEVQDIDMTDRHTFIKLN